MIYAFILGTNHSLCKVEILNVLTNKGIDISVLESSQEGLILETNVEIEKKISIDSFGSTAKIVKILSVVDLKDFFENFAQHVTERNLVDELILTSKGKHTLFGLSVYGFGGKFKDLNYGWYIAPSICREIRADLSSYKIKSSFIPLKERKISTASIDNNKILEDGFELVVGIGSKVAYIGKTVAIQDYKSYSFRDYGRPARDPHAGMIPPKLAKMMINLSNKDINSKILDPFCGSGTFLEELALLGYKNITGADLEEKAVNDSKTNLAWIFENYNLDRTNFNFNFFRSDVREISGRIKPGSIDAIITEPYLGSVKARHFSLQQISKEIKELQELYLNAFNEFNKIVAKDGKLVIVFPVFRNDNNFYHLEIISQIKKIGFKPVSYVPEKFQNQETMSKLALELDPARNTITYYRPDQTVSREIFIFTRV